MNDASPARTGDRRLLVVGALLASGAVAAAELWQYVHPTGPVLSDFFGLWSWSRFVATQGVGALYDPQAMHRFQRALDPTYTELSYPFLYPPIYLLIIWPLGHLPLAAARLLWSAATLAAFVAALAGRRWRLPLVPAALVAPATVLCLICGQNGLLTAALMLGGLRLAASRPIAGGVLLGLLSYKPHLALLVPVALTAARLWPALLAAALTTLLLIALSAALFGVHAWTEWIAAQPAHWAIVQDFITLHQSLVPTVAAALRQLGVPGNAANIGQALATAAAASAVWTTWRRGPGATPIAVLAIAALLATPYAFHYDMPLLAGASLLWLDDARARGQTPSTLEILFSGAALVLPQLMFVFLDAPAPLAAPVMALILAWLLLPTRRHAPVFTETG